MESPQVCTWEEVLADFLLEKQATKEAMTERFYRVQLRQLLEWMIEKHIPLPSFHVRHMRAYLAYRKGVVAESTLRSDAMAARVFTRFAHREGYIETDPLREFKLPKASEPYVPMPSDEQVRRLLKAIQTRWDPRANPAARYIAVRDRRFLKCRDYAIVLGLLATECRIGEMLSLLRADYDPARLQIAVRQAKGNEPRVIPISPEWRDAIDAWLRARSELKDCPWLFRTEVGTQMQYRTFQRSFQRYMHHAGLIDGKGKLLFTLHSLRHWAITHVARVDVLTAARVAGHKDLKTTLRYVHADPEVVRADMEKADLLGSLMGKGRQREKTAGRRKRL